MVACMVHSQRLQQVFHDRPSIPGSPDRVSSHPGLVWMNGGLRAMVWCAVLGRISRPRLLARQPITQSLLHWVCTEPDGKKRLLEIIARDGGDGLVVLEDLRATSWIIYESKAIAPGYIIMERCHGLVNALCQRLSMPVRCFLKVIHE